MVLPQGVSKGAGLRAALSALRLSVHNAVGIGDAENDHDPAPLAQATSELRASGKFTQVTGPLNPVGGITLTPAQFAGLCGALGPASKLPAMPPCRRARPWPDPGAGLSAVPGHRE